MNDTVSSKIRKEIVFIMKDCQTRNVPQIKEELEKKGFVYNHDYKESHLSSVLHLLKKSGELNSVGRGSYIYNPAKATKKNSETNFQISPLEKAASDAFSQIEVAYGLLNYSMSQVTIASVPSNLEWERIKSLLHFKEDIYSLLEKYRADLISESSEEKSE